MDINDRLNCYSSVSACCEAWVVQLLHSPADMFHTKTTEPYMSMWLVLDLCTTKWNIVTYMWTVTKVNFSTNLTVKDGRIALIMIDIKGLDWLVERYLFINLIRHKTAHYFIMDLLKTFLCLILCVNFTYGNHLQVSIFFLLWRKAFLIHCIMHRKNNGHPILFVNFFQYFLFTRVFCPKTSNNIFISRYCL